MKIVYRKGSENDFHALNIREDLADFTEESIIDNPILKQKFEIFYAGVFEKELEDLRESLMEMTHLQCDDDLIKDICNEYLQDPSFNGATLPAGVCTLDPNNGLYWITNKICVPNISTLKERFINEFHKSTGHSEYERTYSVILRPFCGLI